MNESSRRDFLQKLSAGLLSVGIFGCSRNSSASDEEIAALYEFLEVEFSATLAGKMAVGISFGVQRWGSAPHLGAVGNTSILTGIRLGPETPLRIASVTKTFIAVATLTLVEAGKLRLDQPIGDFFPNYPEGDKATIYHLLSHTSGLKDWWEAGLPEDSPGDFPQQPHPHRVLERASEPYHFRPGEHHWYSNTGYVLLGDIIETVSGQRLGEFLRTRIFQPAKLENTFFDPTAAESAPWSAGHHLSPESESGFAQTSFTGSPGAAGGIWSSASDLLRWSNALYKGTLLPKATVSEMSEYARLADGRPVYESTWYPNWMETAPPKSEFMQKSGWGIGFSIFTSNGHKVVWHSGGIPGFNAIWLNVPEKSLSIAMLANTDNGVVPAFNKIVPEAILK